MSRERPILFNGDMVRAILEGRKTMTRRVMKHQPGEVTAVGRPLFFQDGDTGRRVSPKCPYGQQGDHLWVRETFADEAGDTRKYLGDHIYYRADGDGVDLQGGFWTPSIYMPRWASRITLEVTGVRVERLQDISEVDAHNEGITLDMLPYNPADQHPCRTWFRGLWEQINGPGSWDANPWVWVVEFRRLT
tara:strand:+ start:447 stop:1016 length:570 start_codon:yes stop_codon:yes gene_type:complete